MSTRLPSVIVLDQKTVVVKRGGAGLVPAIIAAAGE
jgi:hypothetical protein